MKHVANKVAKKLDAAGITAAVIHGNKSQSARTEALAGFKDGRVRVLVATDIAARGLDVDGISHVINYDLPVEPETYVHRIGRTARAGADGDAVSFCSAGERDFLRAIEKLIRVDVPVDTSPRLPFRGRPPGDRRRRPPGSQGTARQQQRQRQPWPPRRPASDHSSSAPPCSFSNIHPISSRGEGPSAERSRGCFRFLKNVCWLTAFRLAAVRTGFSGTPGKNRLPSCRE